MICANCGHENAPDASSCGVCGAALASPLTCATCGGENTPEARFCSTCGSALGDDGISVPSPGAPEGPLLGAAIPPRSIGELISKAFDVYSSSFRAFALIALIGQIPGLIAIFLPTLLAVLAIILGLLLSILANGATVHAVVQQHLDARVDVALGFRVAWSRVVSLIGAGAVAVVALVGCMILMLIIVGIPLFVYVAVALVFVGETVIIERKSALAAVMRSRQVVQGDWWRVFGIAIVGVLIAMGAAIVGGIVSGIIPLISQDVGSLLFTVYMALVLQTLLIGRTLLYFDLRARKESYDLSALAREAGRE